MGKFDGIIADAKVAMTDIALKSINHTGSKLRVREYLEQLRKHLSTLEADKGQSFFARFRDAMFDTSEDAVRHEAARQLVNLTYQLNRCLHCRCITCAKIDHQACRCEGCLFGSHVTECDGGTGTETRAIEKGVYLVDGMPAVRAEFDRRSGRTTLTLLDRNGVERRFLFDQAAGKKEAL